MSSASVYGNADLPWAETFDLNLTSGAQLITVKQMMPDIEGDASSLRYSLFYRNSRSDGTPERQTPPRPVRPDGYVDFRTTGRDIRLKIEVGDSDRAHLHRRPASGRRRGAGRSLMATQSPPASQPPPDLPHMPEVSTTLTTICAVLAVGEERPRRQDRTDDGAAGDFAAEPSTRPPRVTPKVYKLQVNEAGVASLAPVALANPATPDPPGASIPIFPEAPSDGTVYGRVNASWIAVVPLAGGTMTGLLLLSADPTDPLGAATKDYVDAGVATALPLAGGTLTGPLVATDVTADNLTAIEITALDTVLADTVELTGAGIQFDALPGSFLNDAAAASAGVPVGGVYRNGSILMVRVA